MRLDSLAFRLVAGATLWSIAALLAGGLALSSAFRISVEESFDARLAVLLESLVAVSEADEAGAVALSRSLGEARFEEPYSGWYWQISGAEEALVRSRSLFDMVLAPSPAPAAGALAAETIEGPDNQELRAATRSIMLGTRSFSFTVAADEAEIEAQVDRFNGTLVWSLGLLGAGLIAAVLIQVHFGLLPLGRVGAALAAIRRGRSDRLTGQFPAEVTPLANELNALLAQNAAIVERARTHAGNLAHALKTPLSVLANEAGAGRGPLAETVTTQVDLMRRQVDHHLVRARTAATIGVIGARAPVAQAVEDLSRVLRRIHAGRGVAHEIDCAPGLVFRGERQDLDEMIGNLMDNASKWAESRMRVTARAKGGRLTLAIEDDGPGLGDAEIASLVERGARLDESVPGSGLGLAIVRDIAGLYAGSLTLDRSPALGGVRATLDLPAAET